MFKPSAKEANGVETEQLEKQASNHLNNGLDEEDGGIADRVRLEKKLVRKLDARFSILIVIYILN